MLKNYEKLILEVNVKCNLLAVKFTCKYKSPEPAFSFFQKIITPKVY